MFVRLVYESFRRQKRRKLLAGAAITLGVTVATAMIAVATDIGDKINRELRAIGANLVITPQEDSLDVEIGGVNLKPPSDGAFLSEADLPKIKGIFWHNNITGFAPMLPVNVTLESNGTKQDVTLLGTYFAKQISYGNEHFATGVRTTYPWWKVAGEWPRDDSQDVLLGEKLAAKLGLRGGDAVVLGESPGSRRAGRTCALQAGCIDPSARKERAPQDDKGLMSGIPSSSTSSSPESTSSSPEKENLLRVSGVVSTGGAEDDEIVAPLRLAQDILGRPDAVRRVYVSALTRPEDTFARRDPKSMSGAVYDRWYCTPYPQAIALQLTEAMLHSHAEQIRQVSQNEGAVLARIEGLIFLITLAALFASALAVSAAMATTMFERRSEIGLMKALGAGKFAVAAIFFAEAALLALMGGLAGFGIGAVLARQMGKEIFGSQISIAPVLLPVILAIAVIVTFAGSAAAIRRAVSLDPVFALRGEL